jgi:predicted AAA+ superfamily ATPase
MYSRLIDISLPQGKTAFLWGVRQTGKSTYLKSRFQKQTWFNLLESDTFFEFSKAPSLLRERIRSLLETKTLVQPVIIDEVQKVPALLDEIHLLIEEYKVSFILAGSSARKLKRGHGNLLGGRAWRYQLFPLVYKEIPKFDLLRALNNGLLPSHYNEENASKSMTAYISDYIKEEIAAEGIARNIPAFSRFVDSLRFANGELVNYTAVARDCGVDSKTVKAYFQILSDTLMGTLLLPYKRKPKRTVLTETPKFYLFDVGIAGHIEKRSVLDESGREFGRAFEHFIFMELSAYRSYSNKEIDITFWRTPQGQEIDFVINEGEIAIEVKGKKSIDDSDLKNMRLFNDDYRPKKSIVVSNERLPRKTSVADIIPWRQFLERLWMGDIM